MSYPPVVIVNEHDEVVGEAPLAEARARGLIYRIVFIMCEDDRGRFLLQKRSPHMQLYPNCWDVAAGGHVDDGHSYEEAARVELIEELGVDIPFQEVAHWYSDKPLWGDIAAKRFIKIYHASLQHVPHKLSTHEVASVRWFTKDEIRQLALEQPKQLAEGLQCSLPFITGDS